MDNYYFFLSYARRDYDDYLADFYNDLVSEIRRKTALNDYEIGFFDASNITLGDSWSDKIAEALQTSRVLVCLYSPAYFISEYNGKELQVFQSRLEHYQSESERERPPVILPVLWSPPYMLPSLPMGLSNIQHLHIDLPDVYNREGLRYIMRLNKYKDDYYEFLSRFSNRLIEVAESYALPKLENLPALNHVDSAFHSLAPDLPVVPKHVKEAIPTKPELLEKLRAFLCHASDDKPKVRDLYKRLRLDGVDPWLDEENLLPGQIWHEEIPKAVRSTHVVIVCLSGKSINKAGYVQKEIKFALDVADEQPEGSIFVIPLKLEECEIPNRLKQFHYGKLFEDDGYQKLMNSLKLRANQLAVTIKRSL